MKLHLGCGLEKKEGYINVDHIKTSATDVVSEIDYIFFQRYDENSVDEILMINVLEHLNNPILIIKGCYEILKPGGKLIIEVPHFTNPNNYNDPTHKTRFGHGWFNPFVKSSEQMDYLFDWKFSSMDLKLIFSNRKNTLINILERFVNNHKWFYEYSPLKIITCMRIRVELIK